MTTAHAIFGTRQSDPVSDLELARAEFKRSSWWEKSGLEEHWPLDLDEAVTMLDLAGEFAIDADQLKELIGRRLVPNPSRDDDGELAFDAFDMVQVAGVLHGRGQFKPTPSRNDSYKHPLQVVLEQAREAGEVASVLEVPQGLPKHDLRDLLVRLAQTDSREGREKILVLTKVVLEVEHGVFIT
jgi:hypothetical protein